MEAGLIKLPGGKRRTGCKKSYQMKKAGLKRNFGETRTQ